VIQTGDKKASRRSKYKKRNHDSREKIGGEPKKTDKNQLYTE